MTDDIRVQLTLDERVTALEEAVKTLQNSDNEAGALTILLRKLVMGDDDLSVPSLRDETKKNSDRIAKLETLVDRAKWLAVGLGATNIGLITTVIAQLLGGK